MANETGHARNTQRFQEMISFVSGYGAAYAPTNPNLDLLELNSKLTDANAGIDNVSAMLAPSKTAINNRETAFAGLRKLTTRVVNYYASTGAASNSIDDARTLKRKIDGKRAEQVVPDDPSTPEDESAVSISASQQSYTQLVEHLDNLIALLTSDPLYIPNETNLQVASLQTLSANMKAANTAVITTFTPLSNARLGRDNVLYAQGTGLVDTAMLVKNYVKALFGADSLEYKQISGLEFSRPKK